MNRTVTACLFEGPFEELPTWQEMLDAGAGRLSAAGVAEAELDAWYLLSDSFSVDRVHFLMDRNRTVHPGSFEKGWPVFAERIGRRALRIPLQQILGCQEFMGLSFQVNDQVLIPRQDTETLVEEILKDCQNRDVEILDLCTGSGCIGLSLAVLGRYRSVSAADISEGALKIALKNARNLFMIQKNVIRSQSKKVSDQPWRMELSVWTGEAEKGRNGAGIFGNRPGTGRPLEVEERSFSLFQSDLFSADDGRLYDVIVSNPPYIPSAVVDSLEPEVREHEPRLALDGREDGLYFYRRLAEECGRHLKPGGRVYFEIGHDQGAAVTALLEENGYRNIQVIKDAPGLDRVVKAEAAGR